MNTKASMKPKRVQKGGRLFDVFEGKRGNGGTTVLPPTVKESIAVRVLCHGLPIAAVAGEARVGWQAAHDAVVDYLRAGYAKQIKKAFVAGRLSNSPNLPPALAKRAA